LSRPTLILLTALTLTGCQTVAANVATNLAIDLVTRPVIHLAMEGGKAAFNAAEDYWREIGDG
jgi:hypothetical protein